MHRIDIMSRQQAESVFARRSERSTYRHAISIICTDDTRPNNIEKYEGRLLQLRFDDLNRHILSIQHNLGGFKPPNYEHVQKIIDFAKGVDGNLLVHCAAGISRSAGAALTVITTHMGDGKERQAIDRLMRFKASVWPNDLIVHYADELLGRNGKLWNAYYERFESREGGPSAGLCDTCEHGERNAIRFINCLEGRADPSWPFHPHLPVHGCERYRRSS